MQNCQHILRHANHASDTSRRGMALLVVLVVVTLLSLSVYTFSDLMVLESKASRQFANDSQARELANSAVEYVAALLGDTGEDVATNYWHNPDTFSGIQVVQSTVAEGQGWFSVVAPMETDITGNTIRFGLMNESARLNLNAIAGFELSEEEELALLLAVPGMTEEIADAILDWLDADDTPRFSGAEFDTYQAMTPPYLPANGPLQTIDELLLIRGVTPQLLYGEDANRNGLLDPNENDGDMSLPADDADGVLNPGWIAYLCVHSKEVNTRPDGTSKIDVNQPLLTELYDQIAEEYDEELAKFITAYRIGTTNVEPLEGQSNLNTTGDIDTDNALKDLATSLIRTVAAGEDGSSVTRGGLDLSQGAVRDVASLYELIGAEVDTLDNGNSVTLTSPFTQDAESLKLLFDNFTTTSAATIDGRVNVNEAREEVLWGIPEMPEGLPAAIIAARPSPADAAATADILAQRTNTGWILLEGLADLTTMRKLDRFLTTGGTVYRMQAIGRFDGPGPTARVEALIDTTEELPRILFHRDLSELGPGYRLEQLRPSTSPF